MKFKLGEWFEMSFEKQDKSNLNSQKALINEYMSNAKYIEFKNDNIRFKFEATKMDDVFLFFNVNNENIFECEENLDENSLVVTLDDDEKLIIYKQ